MTDDRKNPPPGFTVEHHDDAAGWVARNPDGLVITMGWQKRGQVVKIAWDARDTIARSVRDQQAGWFAVAKEHTILGGPYDLQAQAGDRLARYVDDGTFRTAYGRRDDSYRFAPLPEPAKETA